MAERQTITSFFCNLFSWYLHFPRYFMFTHPAVRGKVSAGVCFSWKQYLGCSTQIVMVFREVVFQQILFYWLWGSL